MPLIVWEEFQLSDLELPVRQEWRIGVARLELSLAKDYVREATDVKAVLKTAGGQANINRLLEEAKRENVVLATKIAKVKTGDIVLSVCPGGQYFLIQV